MDAGRRARATASPAGTALALLSRRLWSTANRPWRQEARRGDSSRRSSSRGARRGCVKRLIAPMRPTDRARAAKPVPRRDADHRPHARRGRGFVSGWSAARSSTTPVALADASYTDVCLVVAPDHGLNCATTRGRARRLRLAFAVRTSRSAPRTLPPGEWIAPTRSSSSTATTTCCAHWPRSSAAPATATLYPAGTLLARSNIPPTGPRLALCVVQDGRRHTSRSRRRSGRRRSATRSSAYCWRMPPESTRPAGGCRTRRGSTSWRTRSRADRRRRRFDVVVAEDGVLTCPGAAHRGRGRALAGVILDP